ncbi:MAG: hypothetical protein AAF725_03890 [Acidobacteriota bacterium]
MKCRKIKEEHVFVFAQGETGKSLTVAIRRHVSICPDCARQAAHAQRIVAIVRERCARETAPVDLRERIVATLRDGGKEPSR